MTGDQDTYRVLSLNGKPSEALYKIIARDAQTSLVTVAEVNSIVTDENGKFISATKKIKNVTVRRLLPPNSNQTAAVIEHSEKYSAHCPTCGEQQEVQPEDCSITCGDHGEFPLHWIGGKPVSVKQAKPKAAAKTKTDKPKAKPEPKPKAQATPKPPQQKGIKPSNKVAVDLSVLDELGILFVKEGLNFDHPGVEVKAYVLITEHNGQHRKYCFNTYGGALGKKVGELPIDNYKDPTKGHEVKDLESEKNTLQKKGYRQIQNGTKPKS